MIGRDYDYMEWLGGLVVGDRVAYDQSSVGQSPQWVVHRVEKITPTRMFVLSNGLRFNNKGDLHALRGWYHLVPVTPYIEEQMTRRRCIQLIERAMSEGKLKDFETQRLIDIANIIQFGKA